MKPLYLPDTLERFILPTLKPLTQLVFYKLIRYSGIGYKQTIWPSVATLARLCNVKKRDTIRASLYELQSEKIIVILPQYANNRRTSNQYLVEFAYWENIDRIRGIDILQDDTKTILKQVAADVRQVKKNTKPNINQDLFASTILTEGLKIWEQHLEPMGKFKGTYYFSAKSDLSPAFVEEQFRRAGIAIKVLKSAAKNISEPGYIAAIN